MFDAFFINQCNITLLHYTILRYYNIANCFSVVPFVLLATDSEELTESKPKRSVAIASLAIAEVFRIIHLAQATKVMNKAINQTESTKSVSVLVIPTIDFQKRAGLSLVLQF